MRRVLYSLLLSNLLFGASTLSIDEAKKIDNEAPDNSSTIEKQLEELNNNNKALESAKVSNLVVDKNVKGKSEVQLKKVKFLLRGLRIKGNTIFPKKDIVSIIKPYVGKMVTNDDLKDISKKITDLYYKNGYITSKCIIPAQKVVNGNVYFKIIEDKLGRVVVVGKKAYNYNNNIFMRYLYDLQGKILNINELNDRLKLLSNLPVTSVTPKLQRTNKGFTILVLDIKDRKQKMYVSLDNGGSKYTGVYRINMGGNINNIRGVSDSLSINVLTVKNPKYLGSFGASYVTPFNNKGAKLVFSYSTMYYQLDPDEVGTKTVIYSGTSDTSSIYYVKPFYSEKFKSYKMDYKLGIEKKDIKSQTTQNSDGSLIIDSEDKTFVLSGGVDISFADKYFKNNIGINSISLSIKHALEGVFGSMTKEDVDRKTNDTTIPLTGPIKYGNNLDVSFTKLYYSYSRQQKLPKNFILNLSFGGDYTKHRIPRAYEYGGHDWGYSYSASIKHKLMSWNTSIGISKSVVYDYQEDGTEEKTSNKPGLSFSTSRSFGNLSVSLSYSSSLATWNSTPKDIKFNTRYSW